MPLKASSSHNRISYAKKAAENRPPIKSGWGAVATKAQHNGGRGAVDPRAVEIEAGWGVMDTSGWTALSREDRLREIVPFWIGGVIAAHKGEEPSKMEGFLEALDNNDPASRWASNGGWGLNLGTNVWPMFTPEDADGDGEGRGAKRSTGASPSVSSGRPELCNSEHTAWSNGGKRGMTRQQRRVWNDIVFNARRSQGFQPLEGDPQSFVEKIAVMEHANSTRKEEMYRFFSMSTQEKVRKIYDVVEFLRVHPSA